MFELSLPTFRKVSMLKRIVRLKKLIHPRPMMMFLIGNLLQGAPPISSWGLVWGVEVVSWLLRVEDCPETSFQGWEAHPALLWSY